MNYAIPVLVGHYNEDFRSHLREMLTKHGFFHVIEAATEQELMSLLSQEKSYFAIVHSEMADGEVLSKLKTTSNGYMFITQPDSPKTLTLAVQMGVKHLLNFPFSSQQLVEKLIQHQ